MKEKTLEFKKVITDQKNQDNAKKLQDKGFIEYKQMTEELYLNSVLEASDVVDDDDEEDDTTIYFKLLLLRHDRACSITLSSLETILSIFSSYFYTY